MKTCILFGGRNTPLVIMPLLRAVVEELIEEDDVGIFYVGNCGRFEEMALVFLRQMQLRHSHIHYVIVRRSEWLMDLADVVVTHVTRNWGWTARHVMLARLLGKRVINLDPKDLSWMSVPLMERIIRSDVDGTGPLTEDLALAVMAELSKKRPHTGHTAQEAWEIFQRDYLPRTEIAD